jgi:enterochelin esterase-like enzyme
MAKGRRLRRFTARWLALVVIAAGATFLAVGFVGIGRHGRNYWLYRGFPPPHDPAFVKERGSVQHIKVASAALGGRSQDVYVYLPPGYSRHPRMHYPVLYLLHGFPGRPLAFLLTVRMGVVEDELVAKHRARPLILVLPFGSTGTFTDKEWANGLGSADGWATFVSRDVVHAIDARYRTIATRSGRAIGGLSEGGYGAINIALQHPREYSLVESWSGYELAPHDHSIFGRTLAGLAENSPLERVRPAAPLLRRLHTYFWFYTGSDDSLRHENEAFARALDKTHVAHRYLELAGGHNWALWRGMAWRAYLAAAPRLARA